MVNYDTLLGTLNYCIDNPLLLGAATPSPQVTSNRLVNLDESGFFIDDVKLVLVHKLMIARSEFSNRLIVIIQDGDVTVSMAIPRIMVPFKAKEDVFAPPTGGLEIGRPDAVNPIARPNQVAVITKDIRPGLSRPVLLGRSIWITSEGSNEQIPLFDISTCRDGDVQLWRSKV